MAAKAEDVARAKFPSDDQEAIAAIEANYVFYEKPYFIIRPKVTEYKPTEREGDAIDYLCNEWDWGYDPSLTRDGGKE